MDYRTTQAGHPLSNIQVKGMARSSNACHPASATNVADFVCTWVRTTQQRCEPDEVNVTIFINYLAQRKRHAHYSCNQVAYMHAHRMQQSCIRLTEMVEHMHLSSSLSNLHLHPDFWIALILLCFMLMHIYSCLNLVATTPRNTCSVYTMSVVAPQRGGGKVAAIAYMLVMALPPHCTNRVNMYISF